MSAYRFAVPNGVYQVDLSFAELQLKKAGARVFSVSLEGTAVISNLDVFAAAGGQRVAYDRSFIVEVTDGVLDIGFRRPARRPADRQRDPRDGAATGQSRQLTHRG